MSIPVLNAGKPSIRLSKRQLDANALNSIANTTDIDNIIERVRPAYVLRLKTTYVQKESQKNPPSLQKTKLKRAFETISKTGTVQ